MLPPLSNLILPCGLDVPPLGVLLAEIRSANRAFDEAMDKMES